MLHGLQNGPRPGELAQGSIRHDPIGKGYSLLLCNNYCCCLVARDVVRFGECKWVGVLLSSKEALVATHARINRQSHPHGRSAAPIPELRSIISCPDRWRAEGCPASLSRLRRSRPLLPHRPPLTYPSSFVYPRQVCATYCLSFGVYQYYAVQYGQE